MSFDREGFYRKPKGEAWGYLVQNWGRDAGHACMGIFLTTVAWALMPDHPYWAAAIGGNLWAVPREIYDALDRSAAGGPFFALDTFSDYTSYQWGWALVVALTHGLGYGALVFLGITGLYLFFVWRKVR